MAYPEWVEKNRLQGCEIKCISGKYYLYNRNFHSLGRYGKKHSFNQDNRNYSMAILATIPTKYIYFQQSMISSIYT